jgi:predicted small lipoprotein YifL
MTTHPVRVLLAAITAIAAIAGLAGCGAAGPVAAPSPSPAPPATAPSTPGSPAPSPAAGGSAGIPDSAFAGHRAFTGAAVAKYGQAALLAAYKEMVGLTFAAGWSATLIRKDDTRLSSSDFAGLRSYLTPARRAAFDATFARVVRSDRAAIHELEDVAFFGITGAGGLTPVPAGSVVTGRRFTDASVALDDKGRLTMSFAAKAAVQLQDATGRRYALPTARTVRYVLTRGPGGIRPFLVDSWAITVRVSRPERASGT